MPAITPTATNSLDNKVHKIGKEAPTTFTNADFFSALLCDETGWLQKLPARKKRREKNRRNQSLIRSRWNSFRQMTYRQTDNPVEQWVWIFKCCFQCSQWFFNGFEGLSLKFIQLYIFIIYKTLLVFTVHKGIAWAYLLWCWWWCIFYYSIWICFSVIYLYSRNQNGGHWFAW